MWEVHYTSFNKHVPGLPSAPRHDLFAWILAVPYSVGRLSSRRKLQVNGAEVSLRWVQIPLVSSDIHNASQDQSGLGSAQNDGVASAPTPSKPFPEDPAFLCP